VVRRRALVDRRRWCGKTVGSTCHEQGGGHLLSDGNAVGLALSVRNRSEGARIFEVKGSGARWL
jgi:hypothetical protein